MLVHPTFFAPILQYVLYANAEEVVLETHDNYQKQTYRNRCYIYAPNGKQLLSVPVMHSKGQGRQKTRDVRIDNSFPWQKNMIRSLEAAYRSSPFFEFYEDDIRPLFEKRQEFLLDLNLATTAVVHDCLQLSFDHRETDAYQVEAEQDFRYLVDAKSQRSYAFSQYKQVFDDRSGFLPNLSILDLLFNEGTNTLQYLEQHKSLLF